MDDDEKPTVTLLLPTLNEIDGMRFIVPQLDRNLFDDILVLDGGSTDGTVEYAVEQKLRVERQNRPGLAPGVFDAIYAMKTTYVIEFSPDANCMVEKLPELVARLKEGYDQVMVSRYLPPAKSEDDNFITALGNFAFSKMFSMLGSFPITDVLGMYRGFRCNIVRSYDFERYLLGPVLEPLVSGICTINNLKMMEISGDEPARIGGASKMSVIYNGSCILLMYIRLFLRRFLKVTL